LGISGPYILHIQSNLGYTNLSCTKSWIIRIFCPVPAKSPIIPYIKSLSYTKPELYDRFSRSQPKIYLVYTNFRYGLRGKIAHFSDFSLFCFNSNADFFSYFVNLRFYVNCLLFYGIVQGHNTAKSQCRRQSSIPNRWDGIKVEVSVSILRHWWHRAQANFSGQTRTGKGMKLSCISYIVIPNEPILKQYLIILYLIRPKQSIFLNCVHLN